MRTSHRILLALLLVFATGWSGAARAEDAEDESDALPLERVTLFTSGVGYFEHRATIQGEREISLTFEAEDVNDLLKSMVVQDLGGGTISAVTYGSRDPVAKALQSFAVDLTNNLTLAQLFGSLRGERVEVEPREGAIQGRILSVETRAEREKEGVVQRDYLNLLTDEGIRSVAFDGIRAIRLLDPHLAQEVKQALDTLALGRDNQKKTVTLSFSGEGERPVRVGYIQETPVWKTSYRLVLSEGDSAYLQGWAIVENTTNRDWDGVVLTLVSGAPVSFTMNLYEPLYAPRPEVEPQFLPGVKPQEYERELQDKAKETMSRARKSEERRRGAARPGSAPPAPAEDAPEMGKDAYGIDRGVETAARGAEVGELFQYRIDTPVVLGRQRSAMIPIVGENVKATKVSVFDASVNPKHPLNGVRLENTTALHLMQGPVTVFDGGTYAGDALLGDLAPGADRLLTYAMDLDVEVKRERKSRPEDLVKVSVTKGVVQTEYSQQRRTTYLVRNDDDKPRRVILSQPVDGDWILEGSEGVERTRSRYRATVEVPAKGHAETALVEKRTYGRAVGLTNLDEGTIAYYLRAGVVPDAVKDAIREVVKQKDALEAVTTQIRNAESELDAIAKEQDRIRKNMGQIDRDSDLYRRYMEKLGSQEDRVEALRKTVQDLRTSQEQMRRNLGAYLESLTLG